MHIDISSGVARPSSQMLSFLLLTLGIPCHRAYTALNPSANYPLATNNFIATAPGGTAHIYQSFVQATTHACSVAWDAELAHSKMTRSAPWTGDGYTSIAASTSIYQSGAPLDQALGEYILAAAPVSSAPLVAERSITSRSSLCSMFHHLVITADGVCVWKMMSCREGCVPLMCWIHCCAAQSDDGRPHRELRRHACQPVVHRRARRRQVTRQPAQDAQIYLA